MLNNYKKLYCSGGGEERSTNNKKNKSKPKNK